MFQTKQDFRTSVLCCVIFVLFLGNWHKHDKYSIFSLIFIPIFVTQISNKWHINFLFSIFLLRNGQNNWKKNSFGQVLQIRDSADFEVNRWFSNKFRHLDSSRQRESALLKRSIAIRSPTTTPTSKRIIQGHESSFEKLYFYTFDQNHV